jgi:TfoX/Sxy family transcriptional regulator of competence genes
MAYDEQLAHRIRSILDPVPGLVEKKMFGGVGYLVGGNMACGVNGDRLIVRMSETDYQDALLQPHVHVFDMTGRPMKGWVTVAPSGINSDQDLRGWVERGLRFAQGLPPK